MRKLQTQLSLCILLILLCTVSLISILSNLLINRAFEEYVAGQQRVKAGDFVTNISSQYDDLTGEWNVEYIHGAGMYALFDGYIVKVYDGDGNAVWDAENHDMAMCAQIMGEISERMEKRRPDIEGAFAAHEYALTLNGQDIGSVVVSYYGPYFLQESDFHFLDALNLALAIVGVLSSLLSLAISAALTRRIARPITKTAHMAKQISDGNYAIRFRGRTKTEELDELTASINHLATRLSEQENLRKRLTVDVAHELRTPLAALSAHLEAMIEGVWEPTANRLQGCHEESLRLAGLVSDLERLAETERDNLILHKASIDLMDVVRTACNHFAAELDRKNLSLKIEGESSFVNGDRDKLFQVMTNLLSNAIKYTPENGFIRISVRDSGASGIVSVEDDGIGIPENELPLIFERFYRTDQSRNRKTGGAGIGLAIVKSFVEAHGGAVRAESRAEGGSRFSIVLPKK